MRLQGVVEIQKKFEVYAKLLKEEFSQGLILPTKDTVVKDKSIANGSPKQQQQAPVVTTVASNQQAINGCKIETKKLKLVEEFKCRSNELYNVFTDINVCIPVFFCLYFVID